VIAVDQPLPLLKREADSIRSVIAKVEEDIKKLRGALTVANYNEENFCRAAGIKTIDQLALSRFAEALVHIQGKLNVNN